MFPRNIDPSLIEDGDTIKVFLPKSKGVETTLTGVVHHRSDSGSTRYLYTEEGSTLLAWEVNRKVHVMLMHRPDYEIEPLFGEEFAERIAS